MKQISNYFYLTAFSQNFVWWAQAGAVALCVCLAASVCQASIIVPELPEFDFQADTESAGSSSDAAVERTAAPGDSDQDGHSWLGNRALCLNGSSSGTTGSSAPTLSVRGSQTALAWRTDYLVADLQLAGWLTGDTRLELPLPPANSLLRPPRG